MAIIKCKMCGGDLELVEGTSVATCEYCGTTQTVPTADSEKKMTLFGRANRLLRACEFDKAAGVFESIVAEFPEEAEAYWGLVLCKYGIEYVDDPATGKKIPTCHRSSFDSVLDDDNFEQATENADAVARKVYREEAKAIEELRRGIIEVSGKEAPYDIFICYKETAENGDRTLDSVLAQDIYDALTEKGYRVFFSRVTLEDKLGQEYEPYIFAALNSAKIMLAVGTDYEYYNAVWVKNEWSRFLQLMASGQKKVLIPCFKGLDPYDMPKEFAKLQSQDLGKVGAMQDLLRGVEKIMGGKAEAAAQPQQVVVQGGGPNVASLLKRGNIELEDKNWDKARELFDQVLSLEPECAEAYLGLVMAEHELASMDAFSAAFMKSKDKFANDSHYSRALKYAGEELAKKLNALSAAWDQMRNAQTEAARKRTERFASTIKQVAGRMIGAGDGYTLGVRSDGTVMATGNIEDRKYSISGWRDIVAVAVGKNAAVGLRSNGTVVATKYGRGPFDMHCRVSDWSNIIAVAVGLTRTIGLKSDGTVVAAGTHKEDVSGWTDIVAIAVGNSHAVGLQSDGTVVATKYIGDYYSGQCDVSDWEDIVAIAAGYYHTLGLKSDGTVVAAGNLISDGRGSVSGWTNIVAISGGDDHAVGLRSDGTVVATGWNHYGQCDVSDWRDIVAVSAGSRHTVGVKSDGTVVATGKFDDGQCNVNGWKLFDSLEGLEQRQKNMEERRRAEEEQKKIKEEETRRAIEERRLAEEKRKLADEERRRAQKQEQRQRMEKERADLQAELANLKGLFSGKRRKEIEARLAEIERYLEVTK